MAKYQPEQFQARSTHEDPRPLMCEGVNVCPFLDREGRTLLAYLDFGPTLMNLQSVTALNGREVPTNRPDSLMASCGVLWPRGVHEAPWSNPVWRAWVAVDRNGRLVASMASPVPRRWPLAERRQLRRDIVRDLGVVLDAADPEPSTADAP